jgi:hypothetical protein
MPVSVVKLRPLPLVCRQWDDSAAYQSSVKHLFTIWGPEGERRGSVRSVFLWFCCVVLATRPLSGIVLWGFSNGSRELAGLVADFHAARWTLFASMLGDAADKNVTFKQTAFNEACLSTIELPWATGNKTYPHQNTSGMFDGMLFSRKVVA